MRCEKNDRTEPTLPSRSTGKARGERGEEGTVCRSDSARGAIPKPPAPVVSNYPLRSGRPRTGSGNHQPISLSAPAAPVVIVPGVHCAPIVIGYQRYFCLNCKTFRRVLVLPTTHRATTVCHPEEAVLAVRPQIRPIGRSKHRPSRPRLAFVWTRTRSRKERTYRIYDRRRELLLVSFGLEYLHN